jgi:hypothetical protein
MIKEDLVSFLTADSMVAAAVDERIYPSIIPQEEFGGGSLKPCIVYERNGVRRDQTLCGTDGLARSSFRLTAFALTPDEAEDVAQAVRGALLDYSGAMGSTQVHTVSLETETDGLDIEPGLHRVDLFLTIWHAAP